MTHKARQRNFKQNSLSSTEKLGKQRARVALAVCGEMFHVKGVEEGVGKAIIHWTLAKNVLWVTSHLCKGHRMPPGV